MIRLQRVLRDLRLSQTTPSSARFGARVIHQGQRHNRFADRRVADADAGIVAPGVSITALYPRGLSFAAEAMLTCLIATLTTMFCPRYAPIAPLVREKPLRRHSSECSGPRSTPGKPAPFPAFHRVDVSSGCSRSASACRYTGSPADRHFCATVGSRPQDPRCGLSLIPRSAADLRLATQKEEGFRSRRPMTSDLDRAQRQVTAHDDPSSGAPFIRDRRGRNPHRVSRADCRPPPR